MNKSLSQDKKLKLKDILRTIPLVSEERINSLGRLLFILSESTERDWYSPIQIIHKNENYNLYSGLYDHVDDSTPTRDSNECNALYRFIVNLKDKVSHGNVDGISQMFSKNSSIFGDVNTYDQSFHSLKNRCLIICSMACVFAIQVNAPYDRIINLIFNFSNSLIKITSATEILLKTIFIIETFSYMVSNLAGNNFSLHVNRVLQYIKNHYTQKVSLTSLAEYVKVNPVYLSSLIKKETGLSLWDHINVARVEEGKNMLVLTNKSVQEIAFSLGFNYQNHFNTVFKKFTGTTPLKYRERHGNNYFDF